MRITNGIMQNNTLYNINNNKIAEDNLSTQMSTGKRVSKPSDDPVVAIRALRLHTNVSEVTQFYTYNSSDAESWMKTTQDAMDNLTDIINKLYEQAGTGAKEDLQASDLKIILKEMNSLAEEYYSIGDTDYAGRFIFTGYRTDMPLTFQEQTLKTYDITEEFGRGSIDEIRYTNLQGLDEITKENFDDATLDYRNLKEQSISETTLKRIRLSYDNIDVPTGALAPDGKTIDGTGTYEALDDGMEKLEYTSNDGSLVFTLVREKKSVTSDYLDWPYPNGTFTMVSVNEKGEAAAYAPLEKDEVRLIPETGELLLGATAYQSLMISDVSIQFTYEKSTWEKGAVNPEHYFACSYTDDNGKTIDYNGGVGNVNTVADQKIEYDIGYNQKVQVNTIAGEAFNPMLQQDVTDLNSAVAQLEKIEGIVADLKEYRESYEEGTDEYKTLTEQIKAANAAFGYIRDNVQRMFEGAVGWMKNYLDQTSLAITSSGTRSARLDLAKNRLMEQKTTYESLQSDNEDSDVAEVTVQLKSVQLSYEAALLATSKIIQTTLLNYL